MSELKLFAGIHQALGRMCLLDGRARRDIAEAAGINPSMLSGYCSGRLVPSLEHLDRLLVALRSDPEDFAEELRMVTHTRRASASARHAHAPKEVAIAEETLKRILEEVKFLIISEMNGLETVKRPTKREQIAQSRAAAERAQEEAIHRTMQVKVLEALLPDDPQDDLPADEGKAGGGRKGKGRKRKEP